MNNWQHGYFAERGYAYNVIADQFPRRLANAALWHGHRPPDLAQPFRYVDLGCGQGVGLCVMAALHPNAEFVGVDFLPEHIAHGRSLAAAAQLGNVQFLEADFLQLAQAPEASLQELGLAEADLAAAHGLLTWVDPEVRASLLELAQRILRPGGLLYLSFNTLPGRLDVLPFQHLVQQWLGRGRSGAEALSQARTDLDQLLAAGANIGQAYPQLQARLQALSQADPLYLQQDYNNRCWQPLFVDQAITLLAANKFHYLGSTRLMEATHHWLPEPIQTLITQQPDRALQELCKDLYLNQVFRRDLFCKGFDPLWPKERHTQIQRLRLQALMPSEQLHRPDAFHFRTELGVMQGDPKIFQPLLSLASGTSIGSLLEERPAAARARLLERIGLLLDLQHLAVLDEPAPDPAPAQRLNRAIAAAAEAGAPYQFTALPGLGCHLPMAAFAPKAQQDHPYANLLDNLKAW